MNKVEEVAAAMDAVSEWPAKTYRERVARAAIAAMEKPTDGMLAACWHNHHPWGENAPPPSDRPSLFEAMKTGVAADWNTMVRAAIQEASTPSPKQETTE